MPGSRTQHACAIACPGGGHVSRSSERAKLKRRLGIGKRVATCHLTAASEAELKFIWSGNTWCFRDAVPSQTFSPGTSESFCFLICVGNSCIVDCGCCAFASRKSCPGEHANVSYVFPSFHAPADSTDRFKKDGISASKAMDEYGIKGRLVLCVFAPLVLLNVLV